jgi:hypothetical protein
VDRSDTFKSGVIFLINSLAAPVGDPPRSLNVMKVMALHQAAQFDGVQRNGSGFV